MKFSATILFVSVLMLFSFLSSASAYSVLLEDYTGTDAAIQLDIDGDGTDSITFTVTVLNPDYADIRGLFFSLVSPDEASFAIGDFSILGADVTTWLVDYDSVTSAGSSSNNINPLPTAVAFDVGIEIGTQGIGTDDIYTTAFTLSYSSPMILGTDFAARLMSVGDTADDRDGSSKLVSGSSTPPGTDPVPEPATMFLFGIGLLGIAGIGRKRLKR